MIVKYLILQTLAEKEKLNNIKFVNTDTTKKF